MSDKLDHIALKVTKKKKKTFYCTKHIQFLAPLGLIGASFANAPWQLYLSEGVLFGIGGCFLYNPSVYLPAQWFKKNRALATGILCASSYWHLFEMFSLWSNDLRFDYFRYWCLRYRHRRSCVIACRFSYEH